jgi:hypothetical protein
MSLFQTIKLTENVHNGLLWGTLFGISIIPLQYGINQTFIKKLNTNQEFKQQIKNETFKLLFFTSSLIGFVYGYNTSRRLTNYFKY